MDVSEKVEALQVWLSGNVGNGVVGTGLDFKADTYWFRILVGDVEARLYVEQLAFEEHAVEKICADLERQQVPGWLVADPTQQLIYTRFGEVKVYDP